MRLVSSHGSNYPALVAPDDLSLAAPWSPELFCGPAGRALRGARGAKSLAGHGATCLEGWRMSLRPRHASQAAEAAFVPIYRQAHLTRLRISAAPEHMATPSMQGPWCVAPNDVVVNKIPPVRAAWAGPRVRRHPVDGNCLLVRGLPRRDAAWLAICLNHPEYEALLTLQSGSGVMPRVGLRALRELRVPPTPPEMEPLSAALREWDERANELEDGFFRLFAEVEAAAEREFAEASPAGADEDLGEGTFVAAAAFGSENWLPHYAALQRELHALTDEAGWRPLQSAVSGARATWPRLARRPQRGRYLKLGDVAGNLFIPTPASPEPPMPLARAYAEPLQPGEVLLSTLVTSPRAAYADSALPRDFYAVDHWARFRFRETPGAWALVLASRPLRRQLERMGTGAVRQFAHPRTLLELRLPPIPHAQRERWERALARHHERRRMLDRDWQHLWSSARDLFEQAHPAERGSAASTSWGGGLAPEGGVG